jgi:hypothetical protein
MVVEEIGDHGKVTVWTTEKIHMHPKLFSKGKLTQVRKSGKKYADVP